MINCFDNLWTETDDKRTDMLNIVKSFLCNASDGQTFIIADNILDFDVSEIERKGYAYDFPETEFDEIVGFKHDYKVDDPSLDGIANRILDELLAMNAEVVEHPERYFKEKKRYWFCNAPNNISCDLCVGEKNECICDTDCPFKCYITKN